MKTYQYNSSTSFDKVVDTESKTRKHVTKVFALLTASIILMSICAYIDTIVHFSGMITTILMFGSIFFVHVTPKSNSHKRIAGALFLSMMVGFNVGSYLSLLLDNPNVKSHIIATFGLTICIFGCFFGSAFFSNNRSFIIYGGLLSSLLSLLIFSRIFVYFFPQLYIVHLFAGLAVFCGYVTYDTHVMLVRAQYEDDIVDDSIALFLDFVNILIKISKLLEKKKK